MLILVNYAGRAADNEWVWAVRYAFILVGVWQLTEKMLHAIEPCTLFVVGFNDCPRGICSVCIEKHGLLGFSIIIPLVKRLDIDGAKLPLFQRIGLARTKASALFLCSDRKPVLEQPNATVDQHALQIRALTHKLKILSAIAEVHDPFDAGSIVP